MLARPEPSSLDVTVMSMLSWLVGSAGVPDRDTDGSIVSINQLCEADALLPAASVTVAVNVWSPSANAEPPAQSDAAPSRVHDTDSPSWSSSAVTVKLASVSFLVSLVHSIETVGAVKSAYQLCEAESLFPAASVAVAVNVCCP